MLKVLLPEGMPCLLREKSTTLLLDFSNFPKETLVLGSTLQAPIYCTHEENASLEEIGIDITNGILTVEACLLRNLDDPTKL